MQEKYKGVIFASVTAFLWGFLAIALKVSLQDLSPIDITWIRFAVAFTILFFYYLIFNKSQLKIIIRPPIMLIGAALCLGLNYLGFITGLNFTSPSVAQVFIQLGPILLAVSGFIIYKERVGWKQLVGLLTALSGLLLFYHEQLRILIDDASVFNKGVLWVIIGATAWAGYSVMQKKLVRTHSPMPLNLVLFGLPALLFLPFVHFEKLSGLSLQYWFLLLFLGINTLIAYGSMAFALKYLEANKISVILTQNPIITFITMAILGALQVSWINPEHFSLVTIVGAAMVISGAIITVFTNSKRKSK
ncbi:MAG: DMT family transporter [Bacteroidales bacterium]|nr:DMT family transporter [Bacteroidales bacterium]